MHDAHCAMTGVRMSYERPEANPDHEPVSHVTMLV